MFGSDAVKLTVSKEKHYVDAIPQGLEIEQLQSQQHRKTMGWLLSGTMDGLLRQYNAPLYEDCRTSNQWTILRGRITTDRGTDYLRNTIGLVQALIEQGGIGVLDLLTLNLQSTDKWSACYFNKEIAPQTHVLVLKSENEDGTFWLHTRGMIKFG